jgi:pyruvate kinase
VRHTKIVVTIGPASSELQSIEALIRAGVDVVRLNFSHGDRAGHQQAIQRVRRASTTLGCEVAILQDLSGPKIRTGSLEGGRPLMLSSGDALEIAVGSDPGRPGRVTTAYEPLVHAARPGARLLLDDGRIELRVEAVRGQSIVTRVLDGGELGEHKGINAPDVPLPTVSLTPKDVADLRFGLTAGVDLVALSFVQSADDIARARAITSECGRSRVPLVAKLERREAIHRLPEIAAVADALMLARGDLGLELPLEEVPGVQKAVLRLGAERGVPVIVATQVLESMRSEFRPTRAEVSDAAGAVDAGAAAIMLSGETAVGAHPVRTVQVLDGIIRHAERSADRSRGVSPNDGAAHLGALCDAAVTLAGHASADAIVALTREGRTARVLSARRPAAPVYAATNSSEVARRLCLWWGIRPMVDSLEDGAEAVARRVIDVLRLQGALPVPATVVIVSANPDIEASGVNFVAVRRVP